MQVTENYQKLSVWQKSYSLVLDVYSLTRMLPKEERYVLSLQMRRAALSIPSNIAEGHERGGKDFVRFLRVAMGSRSELETQLSLCADLSYISSEAATPVMSSLAEISRMISGLIRSLGG